VCGRMALTAGCPDTNWKDGSGAEVDIDTGSGAGVLRLRCLVFIYGADIFRVAAVWSGLCSFVGGEEGSRESSEPYIPPRWAQA